MFKFFWGKGAQQSAERLKTQKNLFQFQKVNKSSSKTIWKHVNTFF